GRDSRRRRAAVRRVPRRGLRRLHLGRVRDGHLRGGRARLPRAPRDDGGVRREGAATGVLGAPFGEGRARAAPLARRSPRVPAAARLAVLQEREFRLLWSGQTVSVFGDAMLLLALSFAVLDLTGSVTDIGLVLAASRAPLVLTVLTGGVVADRVSRRWLMV